MHIPQVHIISPRKSCALHVCTRFSSQVRSLFWAQNLFCNIELMCSEQSLWLVALETHTVLFRCEEWEKLYWREGEGRWGKGSTRKIKKRKRNESRLAGRRGLGYLLSTPLSTSFTVSPFISLSLSFCFLVLFLPFLCLLKEKTGEEGAKVRETERVCWERERGKKGQNKMD